MPYPSRSGGGGGGGGGDRGGDRGGRGGERGDDMSALPGGRRRGGFGRKKVCRFCADRALTVDYKEASQLKLFVTERTKIIPRRISGNCAKHQREVAQAIKRARLLSLLPFTITHS